MQANNPSIQKIADKVLPKLQQSHQEYNKLLDGTIATSGALLSAVNSSDDMESKAKAHEFSNLYVEYKKDEPRLAQLIVDFEKKIAEINKNKLLTGAVTGTAAIINDSEDNNIIIIMLVGIPFVILLIFGIMRFKKSQ